MKKLAIIGLSLLAAAIGAACEEPREDADRTTGKVQFEPPDPRFVVDDAKTDAYIASIDLRAFELAGSDFLSPRYYDPARFGKPLEEVTPADYDFRRLAETQRRLGGVDRRKVLAHIFRQLTVDASSDTERHVAILRFLHRSSVHVGIIQPFHPDGDRVVDPLVLLELNEMYCGQVARVACDLFDAAGYRTRGVSLDGHSIAEIFYNGGWHYIDADSAGGNGLTVTLPNGSIPSLVELSRQPHLLDALPHRFELKPGRGPRVGGSLVRSHRYFSEGAKPDRKYFFKSEPWNAAGRDYGWDRVEREPPDWEVATRPERYQPGAVRFAAVSPAPGGVEIRWKPARDRDHDLLGYRVFVSTRSRGWSYAEFAGAPETARYWSNDAGWTPEMYDALYTLPPHEIALIETSEPVARIELTGDDPVYVTVMPFDEYHERAGKTLYLMSNELRIDRAASRQ